MFPGSAANFLALAVCSHLLTCLKNTLSVTLSSLIMQMYVALLPDIFSNDFFPEFCI